MDITDALLTLLACALSCYITWQAVTLTARAWRIIRRVRIILALPVPALSPLSDSHTYVL